MTTEAKLNLAVTTLKFLRDEPGILDKMQTGSIVASVMISATLDTIENNPSVETASPNKINSNI